jgi:hypothetical protein
LSASSRSAKEHKRQAEEEYSFEISLPPVPVSPQSRKTAEAFQP